jgi:hypothetical protein
MDFDPGDPAVNDDSPPPREMTRGNLVEGPVPTCAQAQATRNPFPERTQDMTQSNITPMRWLTTALLLCIPFGAAQAQVTRVDGTLSNGGTLTITGSNFGTKANAKPLYYWDFSTSTGSSPLSRTSWPSTDVQGALSNAVVAPGSRMALRRDMAGVTTAAGPAVPDGDYGVPFSSPQIYVWAKKYYGFRVVEDGGSNGMNLKFFRMWFLWTHDTYTAYQGSMGPESGRTMPEATQELAKWWTMPHEGNRWIIDEWEYKQSDLNVSNGAFNYIRDGIAAYPRTTTTFTTRTTGFPGGYQRLFFDQISNNELSPGKYLYFDSIYVDDTWQRVVISDEATWQNVVYGSGSKHSREIQIPTSWSGTQIQVSVRRGGIANLATSYLYVLDTQGNPVSTTGFPLSGVGGGTPLKTPKPATSVGAQ